MKKYSHGGMACEHCGGEIDGDGYSKHLGEGNTEGFESEERQGNEPMQTEQDQSTNEMREDGFADAIRNRRQGYAEGGYVDQSERMPSEMKPEDLSAMVKGDSQSNYEDEMKKKKQEKYGFTKGLSDKKAASVFGRR